MNPIHVLEYAVGGFLVSLVVADLLRWGVGFRWPQQQAGFQIELRVLPWILTLAAGPALLWDAIGPFRRREAGGPADLAIGVFVLAIWSGSYGMCVAGLAKALF